MSIKSLIKNETIKIDNHHQGHEISINDLGLHLHKRYNAHSRKRGHAEVRIPLNNGEIEVVGEKGESSSRILKEIQKAFSNKDIRKSFVESLRATLHDLAIIDKEYREVDKSGNRYLNSTGKDRVDGAIIKVGEFFGVNKDDLKEFLYSGQDQIVGCFRSNYIYHDYDSHMVIGDRRYPRTVYVRADLKNHSFIISEARYMIESDFETLMS